MTKLNMVCKNNHPKLLAPIWQSPLKSQRYCKVPKFSDVRKLCCNPPKIQKERPNLRVFLQKDANEIANSEDPDQTAPLGAV